MHEANSFPTTDHQNAPQAGITTHALNESIVRPQNTNLALLHLSPCLFYPCCTLTDPVMASSPRMNTENRNPLQTFHDQLEAVNDIGLRYRFLALELCQSI